MTNNVLKSTLLSDGPGPADGPIPGDEFVSTAQQELVQSCVVIIDRWRTGALTTAQASIQLFGLLLEDTAVGGLAHYIDQLSEIERIHAVMLHRKSANHPARQVGKTNTAQPDAGTDDDVPITPRPNEHPGPKCTLEVALESEEAGCRKHTNESLFAWRNLPPSDEPADPQIELTLRLKCNYLVDVKAAKNDIISHPRCPIFPDSLWANILLGHFINLNKVYSGYYTLESNYRHMQITRDIDISLSLGGSGSKPTKSVQTDGEWAIPFLCTRQAILFAYPTMLRSLRNMSDTLLGNFQLSLMSASTTTSSILAVPSDFECHSRTTSSSSASHSSTTLSPIISLAMPGYPGVVRDPPNISSLQPEVTYQYAANEIMKSASLTHVGTGTSASNAAPSIKRKIVEVEGGVKGQNPASYEWWKQPKWMRVFLWSRHEPTHTPSATATEMALPLHSIPTSEL